MTNEQILKKAIEKVGGCDGILGVMSKWEEDKILKQELLAGDKFSDDRRYYHIIFNHQFAKAFWGIKAKRRYEGNKIKDLPAWKWHLIKMILEEEPLKYLEKFL